MEEGHEPDVRPEELQPGPVEHEIERVANRAQSLKYRNYDKRIEKLRHRMHRGLKAVPDMITSTLTKNRQIGSKTFIPVHVGDTVRVHLSMYGLLQDPIRHLSRGQELNQAAGGVLGAQVSQLFFLHLHASNSA